MKRPSFAPTFFARTSTFRTTLLCSALLCWTGVSLAHPGAPNAPVQAAKSRPSSPAAAVASPDVLLVDGRAVSRERFETWLLSERGDVVAPLYARYRAALRAAADAGIRIPEQAIVEAVEAEVDERVRLGFRGDRERWVAELASAGRSVQGRITERRIDKHAELAVGELAQSLALSPAEAEALIAQDMTVESLATIDAPAATAEADDAVLRISGRDVPRSEYGPWLRRYRGEIEARRFADRFRVHTVAQELGIEVTDEQVDARVAADTEAFVRDFYSGDREMWLRSLKKERRTEEDHLRIARSTTRVLLLLDGIARERRSSSEEELRAFWRERYPNGVRLALRWIRLDAPIPMRSSVESDEAFAKAHEAALQETEALAQRLRKNLSGGQDFALLAERHSGDARTAENGGRPPADVLVTDLPRDVQQALEGIETGTVGSPILAGESYWLVEVLEREDVPFEGSREALRDELRATPTDRARLEALRAELSRDVSVEVLPAMFD